MKIRLFIKPYCGWCHKAIRWLDQRGLEYETIDVMASDAAWDEMVRLSDQDLAPVIEVDAKSSPISARMNWKNFGNNLKQQNDASPPSP